MVGEGEVVDCGGWDTVCVGGVESLVDADSVGEDDWGKGLEVGGNEVVDVGDKDAVLLEDLY